MGHGSKNMPGALTFPHGKVTDVKKHYKIMLQHAQLHLHKCGGQYIQRDTSHYTAHKRWWPNHEVFPATPAPQVAIDATHSTQVQTLFMLRFAQ